MPELPEVEVLCRHLAPLIAGRTIHAVEVRRAKILAPTLEPQFRRDLAGAQFLDLTRRGKYLVFTLRRPGFVVGMGSRKKSARRSTTPPTPLILVGHLGMTGRLFVAEHATALPKHTAVVFDLGPRRLVFEDTRYFGRLTLDAAALTRLGPEPLADAFTPETFAVALRRSAQAIKIRLLDQSLVAGIGNIYASEALFRARISPRVAARRLRPEQIRRLWQTIREVLGEAIACGSTLPLNFGGGGARDGLFYFGRDPGAPDYYNERLQVYDRHGQPCTACGVPVKRIVQAARSTFFCPGCQR